MPTDSSNPSPESTQKSKTKLLLIGGAALLILIAFALYFFLRPDDVYRDISIFEIHDSAQVIRDGSTIAAYKGMQLTDGDKLIVGRDGYLRLCLDQDKYVTLESGTKVELKAAGTASASKTQLILTCGSITSRLDEKLTPNSSYEVITPISVMAVRGTVFRNELHEENNIYRAELQVIDGVVAAMPILPDGSIGPEQSVAAGNTLTAVGTGKSAPEFSVKELDPESLPSLILEDIIIMQEEGRLLDLAVSSEELHRVAAAAKKREQNKKEVTKGAVSQKPDKDLKEPADTVATAEVSAAPDPELTPQESEPAKEEKVSSPAPAALPSSAPESAVNDTPAPDVSPQVTEDMTAETADSEESSASNSDSSGSGRRHHSSGSDPSPSPAPSAGKNVTVTFIDCEGSVFGRQTIKRNHRAMAPLLIPVGDGTSWKYRSGEDFLDYDFNEKVSEDLTLYYK